MRQVYIVSHSYQTYFDFLGSDLILGCGLRDHMITRFASGGIRARLRNKVISFCYFRAFFSVPWSFPVFVCIFLFFVSASSNKKKEVVFHCFPSLHFSILRRKKRKQKRKEKKRKRDTGISWNLKNHWNLATENATLGKHKQTTSESIGVEIGSYVKFGLILILISWGGFSRFISAVEILP